MDFKEASDLLSVPLERIAEVLGKSYATVLAYRTGGRVPPAEVQRRLADFMREHSVLLLKAADNLDPPR